MRNGGGSNKSSPRYNNNGGGGNCGNAGGGGGGRNNNGPVEKMVGSVRKVITRQVEEAESQNRMANLLSTLTGGQIVPQTTFAGALGQQ